MATVLFVVTGARSWTLADGSSVPTGYWAEELVAPFEVLADAGHTVRFATPGGVRPVADERSLTPEATGGRDLREVLDDLEELSAPLRLEDVDLADYDAVFYPGGHGPMEDLAVDETSGTLITAAVERDVPLAIVCHGPAALLASDVTGRTVTGFSNEERAGGKADQARWLLEDRLREAGFEVETGPAFEPKVVVDGMLLTGQNPASSRPLAQRLLEVLPS
ncbi:thiamine biosynthesis protein ThiJ [Janibacter melonis]|uniref:Thiamine biosynthesis protein ThiJ n=1 Tax=Janibacter melonis TaxID=262209 RepID=A0A176QFR7_9MICO|nr:type 1 glutamine amidotransferase domain-containing protein [Janibacter melonis]OAB88553.1 thiamine biosynthesis protein ThiJ [Janibacter melonis]